MKKDRWRHYFWFLTCTFLTCFVTVHSIAKNGSFSWRLTSVSVSRSVGNCRIGHIYCKKAFMQNFIFCALSWFQLFSMFSGKALKWREILAENVLMELKDRILTLLPSFPIRRDSKKTGPKRLLTPLFIQKHILISVKYLRWKVLRK